MSAAIIRCQPYPSLKSIQTALHCIVSRASASESGRFRLRSCNRMTELSQQREFAGFHQLRIAKRFRNFPCSTLHLETRRARAAHVSANSPHSQRRLATRSNVIDHRCQCAGKRGLSGWLIPSMALLLFALSRQGLLAMNKYPTAHTA